MILMTIFLLRSITLHKTEQRNKRTVKVNKANWFIVMSTTIYLILSWSSARIRSYFNSYPTKHLNNNNRTSDVLSLLHEWCSAYLHKTNMGVNNNLLQDLSDLSYDLRKNRKLEIFSTGWDKIYYNQTGFLQTNLFFLPM